MSALPERCPQHCGCTTYADKQRVGTSRGTIRRFDCGALAGADYALWDGSMALRRHEEHWKACAAHMDREGLSP